MTNELVLFVTAPLVYARGKVSLVSTVKGWRIELITVRTFRPAKIELPVPVGEPMVASTLE
jgi:hypothetical protein